MKTILTKKTELVTTNWSGGTSTQLAIYPAQASYRKVDFLFRVSTAKVESEESIFTKLPGVSRKIMVLDGVLKLEHKGHHSVTLKKFETDEFSGDWETKSFGKVTDFNLMTTGNTSGKVESVCLNAGNKQVFHFSENYRVYGIYLLKGTVIINEKNINHGDFIMIWKEDNDNYFSINCIEDTEMVVAKIIL